MMSKYPGLPPFYIENNIQQKLREKDELFFTAQTRQQRRSEPSLSYVEQDSCIPRCYINCLNCCGEQMVWMRLLFPCLCACVQQPFYKQSNANFGVIQNFGKFKKVLDPGLNFVNPFTQKVIQLSRQTQIVECRQPVFTKDNLSCQVFSTVYFRVVNCMNKLILSVQQMVVSTVRLMTSESPFQSIIQDRQKFALKLVNYSNQQMSIWGIHIQNIFIKDIKLDQQMQTIMSKATITKRKAQATLIGAKAMVQTAKLFKQASEALDTKSAHQIRYLTLLSELAQTDNQKILMVKLTHE